MLENKTFFEKHFLLLIYFFFLGLDCFFLYCGNYGSRIFSKPILMIFLGLWFHKNTAMGRGVPPQSSLILFCTYAVLILSLLSDVCALWSDVFVWTACSLLYVPIYLFFLILLAEVTRRANEEKKLIFYVTKIAPTFLLMLLLATAVLWKALGFGTEFYHWCLYFHSFVICLLATVVGNMWGYKKLEKCRLLFALGVAFIVLTNIIFCFDQLYYNRRYYILDVFVAIGNGLATVLVIFPK
jgi:hypothetical protein